MAAKLTAARPFNHTNNELGLEQWEQKTTNIAVKVAELPAKQRNAATTPMTYKTRLVTLDTLQMACPSLYSVINLDLIFTGVKMILFSLRLAVSDGGRSNMLYLYNVSLPSNVQFFRNLLIPGKQGSLSHLPSRRPSLLSLTGSRWFPKALLNFQQIVGVAKPFLRVQFCHNSVKSVQPSLIVRFFMLFSLNFSGVLVFPFLV